MIGRLLRRHAPAVHAGLLRLHFRWHSFKADPGQFRSPQHARCPICGYAGRFISIGNPPRRRAQCQGCRGLERHRLLYRYMMAGGRSVLAGKDVLHFAPEPIAPEIIAPAQSYRTADIARAADLRLDLCDIDLPDASVDVVLCNHVLEHVADDRQALREIHRILRAPGLALLTVPIVDAWDTTYEDLSITDPAERALHFGLPDHLRYYGRDFADRIREPGFELTRYQASVPDCIEFALARGETVFVAEKRGAER